jgi:N-acetylneuraminic acid mutarotase
VLTSQQQSDNYQTTTSDPIPAELFDPQTGTWSPTGWMTAFTNGPLVRLRSGGALAMGGIDWVLVQPRSNAERYDEDAGQWSATGPLLAERVGHFAIAVGDEVLVVGGSSKDFGKAPQLATAEVYNPTTGLFRAVGSMNEARWYPACVVLKDGRVLAAGSGESDGRTAEIYDPASETWTPTGSMAQPRYQGSLSLLNDGRVLAAGGGTSIGGTKTFDLSSAETFDPTTGTWSSAGVMPDSRRLHTAVTLPSGEVLVVGGFHNFRLSTTALYTPCGP